MQSQAVTKMVRFNQGTNPYQAPKEITFNQKESKNLAKEAEKMLAKRAITLVPNQHSAKGFHSSVQKGWWEKTHYKFEGTELIFTNSTFQDGGPIHAKGHPETRGLHVQC